MTGRRELLERIAGDIERLRPDRAVLVGIDGVDGAGKTVFADELATLLRRPVVRAGIDSFHNPRVVRYRRGRGSPEGYFHDSFDYQRLRQVLLDPLLDGGQFRTAVFDHRTDACVDAPWRLAPPGAGLVFDGILLQRPQARAYWDYSGFLRVGAVLSTARGARRDGRGPDPAARSNRGHGGGQGPLLGGCDPERLATVVVDNTDLARPFRVRP